MKLIDTHCHLDADEFAGDRANVIAETIAANVDTVVIPGIMASQWNTLLQLCQSTTTLRLLPALGLHPYYIESHEEAHLEQLRDMLKQTPSIVAVGEIGLDYFVPSLKEDALKAKQLYFFKQQLLMAQHFGKPVILHIRKAHHDVIRLLHELKFQEGGFAHAYSGGIEEAKHLVSMGFRLGIGGAVTYDQSKRLRQIVSELPLPSLVLETDAPDMIPQAYRQQAQKNNRNSPAFLPTVAESIAALKGVTINEVIEVTRYQSLNILRMQTDKEESA